MRRYHHALMMSTISHTMRTIGKSGDYRSHNGDYRNHNFDADAKKRQLSTESFSPRAMHMDNPGQYDDWKSTSERTLRVP